MPGLETCAVYELHGLLATSLLHTSWMILHPAAGDTSSKETPTAQWFKAMLKATEKVARQEAEQCMRMSTPHPVGSSAKPYIQVSNILTIPSPCELTVPRATQVKHSLDHILGTHVTVGFQAIEQLC